MVLLLCIQLPLGFVGDLVVLRFNGSTTSSFKAGVSTVILVLREIFLIGSFSVT